MNPAFNLSLPLTHAYIIVHFIDKRSVETEGITDRLSVDDDVCIYMRLLHAMPTPLSWSGLVWSERERERERGIISIRATAKMHWGLLVCIVPCMTVRVYI